MAIDIHRKRRRSCIVALSPTESSRMHTHRPVWTNQNDSCSSIRPAPVTIKAHSCRIQAYASLTKLKSKLKQTSGLMYRFVPTRWFDGMSTVSVFMSCRTANPKSPIAQVRFDFTRIFFDFRSRCAIAGLPEIEKNVHYLSDLRWISNEVQMHELVAYRECQRYPCASVPDPLQSIVPWPAWLSCRPFSLWGNQIANHSHGNRWPTTIASMFRCLNHKKKTERNLFLYSKIRGKKRQHLELQNEIGKLRFNLTFFTV